MLRNHQILEKEMKKIQTFHYFHISILINLKTLLHNHQMITRERNEKLQTFHFFFYCHIIILIKDHIITISDSKCRLRASTREYWVK